MTRLLKDFILSKIEDHIGNNYIFQIPVIYKGLPEDILTYGTLVAIKTIDKNVTDLSGQHTTSYWRCSNSTKAIKPNLTQKEIGEIILSHLEKNGNVIPTKWIEDMKITSGIKGIEKLVELKSSLPIQKTDPIPAKDETKMIKEFRNRLTGNVEEFDTGYVFNAYHVWYNKGGFFIKIIIHCHSCKKEIYGIRRIYRVNGKFSSPQKFEPNDPLVVLVKKNSRKWICQCSKITHPEPIQQVPKEVEKYTMSEISEIIVESRGFQNLEKYVEDMFYPDSSFSAEHSRASYYLFRAFKKVLSEIGVLQ